LSHSAGTARRLTRHVAGIPSRYTHRGITHAHWESLLGRAVRRPVRCAFLAQQRQVSGQESAIPRRQSGPRRRRRSSGRIRPWILPGRRPGHRRGCHRPDRRQATASPENCKSREVIESRSPRTQFGPLSESPATRPDDEGKRYGVTQNLSRNASKCQQRACYGKMTWSLNRTNAVGAGPKRRIRGPNRLWGCTYCRSPRRIYLNRGSASQAIKFAKDRQFDSACKAL
jgi:hypothetical protein